MDNTLHSTFVGKVEFPVPIPDISQKLENLKEGQQIRINCRRPNPPRFYRSVSTYNYQTSLISCNRLVVDNINYNPWFTEYGLRGIVFRDVTIPEDNHMYEWFITTDGYIREVVYNGIMYEVIDIEILNE
jgi:hypothetical protein